MKRLKVLPLSLREKKRYIAFRVISEEPIIYSDLESAFWDVMLSLCGELGTSRTSAWLMKDLWREKEQIGVVRCNHLAVHTVLAALGLITRLGENRVNVKVLKVSGTIRSLRLNINKE